MITCSYCTKVIEEDSYKRYVRKSKKKKKRNGAILAYHWSCWKRKMAVTNRRVRNVRNPYGGLV